MHCVLGDFKAQMSSLNKLKLSTCHKTGSK
jgi:hypothetical protein